MNKLSKGIIIVALLALLQAGLRIYFALATAGALGSQTMEQVHGMVTMTPMTDADWMFQTIMFGLIGLVGLISAIGLLLPKNWGYYGTIVISVVTIVYDVWAMFAIQGTAAFGLILPVIFIIYLIARRGSLLNMEVRSNEGAGGVRN